MIHVAFAVDRNFLPYTAVAVRSLLLRATTSVHLHFLHEPQIGDTTEPLKRMLSRHPCQSSFYPVRSEQFAGLPVTDHVSEATYYRLCIAELLPASVSRVIYLDGDLIVRDDPAKLWESRRHPSGISAVAEPNASSERLGLPTDAPYLNAGVLVIDLDTWRINGVTQTLFAIANQRRRDLRFWDQDVLALYLKGDWNFLSPRWNLTHRYFFGESRLPMPDDSPAIVHFSGAGLKPWCRGVYHPYSGEFWEHAAAIECYGYRIDNPNSRTWIRRLRQHYARFRGRAA